MGIKMDLGSSDSQASSVSRVTNSRVEAYQSAITALSQFSEASSLQGSAYDSGKNYGQSVLTPLLQGAILYSEGLGQSVSQLPSRYRAEVGDESLDEEQLTAEIRAYEGSLSSLRGLYRLLERDEDVSPSTLRGISDRMGNIRSHIQTVQEKLNKLRAFAAGSNSVFTDLPAVVDAMNVGLGQIRTQFASFTGQFSIPSSEQLAWTKTIAKEWEKREERIAEISKSGKEVLRAAKEARTKGEITDQEYSKLVQFLEENSFDITKDFAISGIQDYTSNKVSEIFISNILSKSPILAAKLQNYIAITTAKYGTSALLVSGTGTSANSFVTNVIDNVVSPSVTSLHGKIGKAGAAGSALSTSSKFSKYLPYGIGAALDFGTQLYMGEDVGDAAIKTAAHVGIALATGALISSAGVAFVVGVAISMALDWGYDNRDKIASFAKKTLDDVGDAVSGFFSGLSSAFN